MAETISQAPDQAQEPDTPSSKQRIFEAAVSLIARHGFSATSVRQIASQAGINVAMISYFYGSKLGLLEAILKEFFSNHIEIARQAVSETNKPALDRLRHMIEQLVRYFRQNPDLVRVAMTELPHDEPQVASLKVEWSQELAQILTPQAQAVLGSRPDLPQILAVLGPALLSSTASHFLLMPIVQSDSPAKLDEEFYDSYPRVIAELFLNGLTGLAAWQTQPARSKPQSKPADPGQPANLELFPTQD